MALELMEKGSAGQPISVMPGDTDTPLQQRPNDKKFKHVFRSTFISDKKILDLVRVIILIVYNLATLSACERARSARPRHKELIIYR